MPPRRGSRFCYSHDPAIEAERAAARVLGGRNKRKSPPPPPRAALPFDLQLAGRGDIPGALLRLAPAIATGDVDARIGRLLVETLRAAAFAYSLDSGANGLLPADARPATPAELQFMQETGKLPPGCETVYNEMLLRGPVWSPPETAGKGKRGKKSSGDN